MKDNFTEICELADEMKFIVPIKIEAKDGKLCLTATDLC